MTEDPFFTTDEVLDYLNLNLRTVYRLLKAGKIPAFRVGRQWRFRKSDLDAWVRARQANAESDNGVATRPRVLVVEDEPGVRDMVTKALLMADYVVDQAPDGRSAVDLMAENEYDLMVTDLKMPGMDGLSVMREARRRSVDMPIIIITGFSTEASAIEAINIGVSGYLTKPFRVPRILSIAARALGDPRPELEAEA